MAIITEEPDSPTPQLRQRKPKPEPESESGPPPFPPQAPSTSNPSESVANSGNPFQFWAYFVSSVSIITLISVLISSLSPQDPRTWFLNLPPILRHHHSNGRMVKVQTAPNYPQIEIFSIHQGDTDSDSRVLFIHGLGVSSFAFRDVVKFLGQKNVHAVAIDLPGSGFSDKSITVAEKTEGGNGFFERVHQVYEDIKEKGLFWGFDQLVEQGYVDLDQNKRHLVKKDVTKPIELGTEEMGKLLGQVVDTFRLVPVDLVLHDSALLLTANWVSENPGLVRSVTILDGTPTGAGAAFPLWVLDVPVLREIVLGFRFVFERVLELCCLRSVGKLEAEGHRILLKGRDGGRAVVGIGKKLNLSFDLSKWVSSDNVKGLPVQVIWSGGWSDKWIAEGRKISNTLSQATLVTHSGGRWTQEQNAEEIGESIHKFVSSLPKPSSRRSVEEPAPGNYDEALHAAEGSDHHQHYGHGGYMGGAHDLGHGWGGM